MAWFAYRLRWYDPVTGRWLSNDPIGISGGLNQYVFCGNNPVNFRDPYGENFATSWGAAGAVAGGGVVAIGSIAADAVTGGLNILATPAEIGLGATIGAGIGYGLGSVLDIITEMKPHRKGARESTRGRHEEGEARRHTDNGNEKGDANRWPRTRQRLPNGKWEPWPPRSPSVFPFDPQHQDTPDNSCSK
jgi:uncharacterized protein RhaS with RHS repeats